MYRSNPEIPSPLCHLRFCFPSISSFFASFFLFNFLSSDSFVSVFFLFVFHYLLTPVQISSFLFSSSSFQFSVSLSFFFLLFIVSFFLLFLVLSERNSLDQYGIYKDDTRHRSNRKRGPFILLLFFVNFKNKSINL
jgi:hypothetical protein